MVHYSYFKARSNKSKKNFVLLHGFGGGQGDYLFYISKLRDFGNVYLLSLPGHDKNILSVDRKSYAISDINHEFFPTKSSNIIFVAHSIASIFFSESFLNEYKSMIDKVFLISPVSFSSFVSSLNDYSNSLSPLMQRIESNLDNFPSFKTLEKINKGRFLNIYKGLFKEFLLNFKENNYQKSSKVKIIWGDDDELIRPSSYDLVDLRLAGCGHNCHIQSPSHIINFITGQK